MVQGVTVNIGISITLVASLFTCLLNMGCIVDNPNTRTDTPTSDAGLSNVDGGVQCQTTCDSSACPSGEVTQNSACQCVCVPLCDEICPTIECEVGQTPIQPDGECCPICVDLCVSNDDCQSDDFCTDEGICVPGCFVCGVCEEGTLGSPNRFACCECVPECGANSPYTCADGFLCIDERCQPIDSCAVACDCPEGTEPSETIAEGECCPECIRYRVTTCSVKCARPERRLCPIRTPVVTTVLPSMNAHAPNCMRQSVTKRQAHIHQQLLRGLCASWHT